MSKMSAMKTKGNLRDQYLHGQLSVDKYVDRILNGKEGDRTRRKIEQKQKGLFHSVLSGSKR